MASRDPWYDPDRDQTLSSLLRDLVDTYWKSYLDYWELQNLPAVPRFSEEKRELNRNLADIGEALRKCTHSLHTEPEAAETIKEFAQRLGSKKELEPDDLAEVARLLPQFPIVRDSIRIRLGFEAADHLLAGAEHRAPVLLSLIAVRSISQRAALFLERATRLYLWGFDPECVIMCAAVLEAALESRFPPEEMFRLQIPKRGPEHDAKDYIHAAHVSGLFQAQDRDMATALRRARNDTIHNAPGLGIDSAEALTALAKLLDKIFPADGESPKPGAEAAQTQV